MSEKTGRNQQRQSGGPLARTTGFDRIPPLGWWHYPLRSAAYEGGDADERRLFYVAITRARDWLSVSRHRRVTKQRVAQSPYHAELSAHAIGPADIKLPPIEARQHGSDAALMITFSELASFIDCGMAYRLRNLIGFQPRLAPELGYGKAVHHVLRSIAETTRDTGHVPTPTEIDHILDSSFFLPTANKVAYRQLKDAARRLITTYATQHQRTCTGSGKPSARSSCTSMASRSAAVPT